MRLPSLASPRKPHSLASATILRANREAGEQRLLGDNRPSPINCLCERGRGEGGRGTPVGKKRAAALTSAAHKSAGSCCRTHCVGVSGALPIPSFSPLYYCLFPSFWARSDVAAIMARRRSSPLPVPRGRHRCCLGRDARADTGAQRNKARSRDECACERVSLAAGCACS